MKLRDIILAEKILTQEFNIAKDAYNTLVANYIWQEQHGATDDFLASACFR